MKAKIFFLDGMAIIFAMMLLFILLITSFEAVCYWTPGYYEKEFEKYDVCSLLAYWRGEEMSLEGFSGVIRQTMVYLKGGRENLIIETEIDGKMQEFYNEDEKSHMADVRDIFVFSITLRALAILCCLAIAGACILMEHWKALYYLGRGYMRACLLIILVLVVFGILASADFTAFFTKFHEIFFKQGNWMFDPRESRMINMLPEGFFSDTALRVALTFLCSMIALLIPSALFVCFGKKWGYPAGARS